MSRIPRRREIIVTDDAAQKQYFISEGLRQYWRYRKGAALRPCPFCGGEPAIAPWKRNVVTRHWVIRCRTTYCPANGQGPQYESKDAAIAAWNNRRSRP